MPDNSLTIRSNFKALSKELQEAEEQTKALGKRQEELNKKYLDAAPAVERAKEALKEATKAFRENKNEVSQTNFDNAVREYKQLSDEMRGFKKEAESTGKEIASLEKHMKDLLNGEAGSSGASSSGGALTGKGAAFAAIGKQLAGNIGQMANTMLSSAMGSGGASMLSGSLEGALSGAAAGAMAGPVGAAIGGLVGALGGAMSGYAQIYQEKDEAFKSLVSDQYQRFGDETDATLSAGSGVASGREQTALSFNTLLGDEEISKRHLNALRSLAVATPYEYDDLTGISKNLLSYGYSSVDSYNTVRKITDSASALNWSTSDMGTVGTVLGRMTSTDKASLEYLNQLADRALPVFSWLAESMDVSQKDVMKMISKGEISGTEAASIITAYMEQNYGGAAERQSHTYGGLSSTLSGAQAELENAMGEGYNALRKGGLQSEIDFLSGNAELEALNRIIGEGRAYTENLGEQYTREAIGAMMGGGLPSNWSEEGTKELMNLQTQYAEALSKYSSSTGEDQALAAADIEATYEAVQALAETEYEASGYAKELAATAENQIKELQTINDSIKAGWEKTYRVNLALSKGSASVRSIAENSEGFAPNSTYLTGDAGAPEAYHGPGSYLGYTGPMTPHATGLERVPYDNYPALLHEGERVLTAQEARSSRSGPSVTVTGNQITVRQESDIDAIADAIARKLAQAAFVGA